MTAPRTITNHFPDFRLLNVAPTTADYPASGALLTELKQGHLPSTEK